MQDASPNILEPGLPPFVVNADPPANGIDLIHAFNRLLFAATKIKSTSSLALNLASRLQYHRHSKRHSLPVRDFNTLNLD
jgi:hypothetical protein